MDVTEAAHRDWNVLRKYQEMAVYLGQLAVQAFSHPGGDVRGQFFPYIPGGDEAADCTHPWMGSPMKVVGGSAAAGIPETRQERASTTTLKVPGTNKTLLVYFNIYARWRCWRPDVGSNTLLSAKIMGFW